MRFGAHLYGTATASSDLDIKGVFLPPARDILLQRVMPVQSHQRRKAPGERNTAEDVDFESYSLQRYLTLLAEGQTVALDMLFAPDSAMLEAPAPIWRMIQENADRLVTRKAAAFVRYCRVQANKFGIKGSRIAAARQVLDALMAAEAALGSATKLLRMDDELQSLVARHEHLALYDQPSPGDRSVRVLDVCGRKVPLTASIKTARETVLRIVEDYGERARMAERQEGIDWKSLSHAVRVGHEALELLTTGRITLPLRNADHIRRIKLGAVDYRDVAAEVERLLCEVEHAAAASSLPEEPDLQFIDDLVASAYRTIVLT